MTTSNPQHEPLTEQERRRNPRFLIVLFVLLCGMFVAGYMERLTLLETARQQAAEMSKQVVASYQRQAELLEEQSRVQDPAYLALRARDDIGLAPEGELMVVIYDGKPQPSETPAASQPTVRASTPKPPWQQWLELIFP
jgi:cell division protein FtsB